MRIFAPVLAVLLASQAHAACAPGQETFLSCTFQNGRKAVDVCVQGSTASYRFGPTGGAAELALTVPISALDYTPWPGIGSNIWERVIFTNGGVSYEVYGSVSKAVDTKGQPAEIYGGIDVFEKGSLLASLTCDTGSVDFPWTDALSQ